MTSIRWSAGLFVLAVLTASLSTACSRHYVVVDPPGDGYSPRDTLHGRLDGDEIRVTFWYDTIYRVRTVTEVDTLWREGARVDTVTRVDSVVRVDTVLRTIPGPGGETVVTPIARADTVRKVRTDTVVRVDTVRVRPNDAFVRPDTVVRVDTVRVAKRDTVVRVDTVRVRVGGPEPGQDPIGRRDTVFRVDTVRVAVTDTVLRTDTILRVDTVTTAVTDTVMRTDTILRVDTVRVAVTDTVVRADTVRVAGRRHLFVPPGHHPPDGQCRVWVPGDPPGQQARPAPCDQLGEIPEGAFILFGGEAWDADWDWVREARENAGSVPPEIVAAKRRGGG